MLVQIDARIAELDEQLAGARELIAERRRLIQARETLTGERRRSGGDPLLRRVTQEEVADFLAEHPGSRAAVIARALGVPLTNISQHLHRGKESRFERRKDGWHLRDSAAARAKTR